jgi:hypothetical protein
MITIPVWVLAIAVVAAGVAGYSVAAAFGRAQRTLDRLLAEQTSLPPIKPALRRRPP